MAQGKDLKPDQASPKLPPEAEQWRRRIDEIDEQILKLLNSRSACAVEIGRIKRERDIPIYSPSRERWILARLEELNPGPLDPLAVRRVFERVIDESRRLERVTADAEAEAEAEAEPEGQE